MTFTFRCPNCQMTQQVKAPIGEAPTPPLCLSCKTLLQRVYDLWMNLGPRATQDAITQFQMKHL